jgi:phage protein U
MPAGIFGSFYFGKVGGKWQTFIQVTRGEVGRYEDQAVWLNKPATEAAGPGLIQLTISMVLNAAWCGDVRPIVAQLHNYERAQVAAPLLLGSKPAGPRRSLFTLRSINEVYDRWLKDGVPLRVELELSFTEYVP